MGGVVTSMVEMKSTHKVLVGKPEGKRPFGRSRRRMEDINTDPKM
jgi:hypothetical protein